MKFIRLSALYINPATIRTISITDTKYTLDFTTERLNGIILFGSGSVKSDHLQLVIDKKENPSDYRVMENWISRNEHY